jgi:hypothetical protein
MTDQEYKELKDFARKQRLEQTARFRKAVSKLYRDKIDALHVVWHLENGQSKRGFLCRGRRN